VELITNIIVEYLKHNKRLCVPKLGTFIVKQSSGVIIFSDLMRNDDGVLLSLLMAYGAKELEANGMIDRFVFEIRHAITTEGKYSVEGLGDFTADRNNTISFTHAHRQQVFGGNIKPPVEVLEQRKTQTFGTQPQATTPRPNVAKPTPRRATTEPYGEESLTLGKPDAYLRGLKYDSNKNKKREESGRSNKRTNGGRGWLMTLLIMAVVAGVGAILWMQKMSTTPITTAPIIETPVVIEPDTTAISEPIIDSLMTEEVVRVNDPSAVPTTAPTTTNE
jgi:nucleoid DNA-binding protein